MCRGLPHQTGGAKCEHEVEYSRQSIVNSSKGRLQNTVTLSNTSFSKYQLLRPSQTWTCWLGCAGSPRTFPPPRLRCRQSTVALGRRFQWRLWRIMCVYGSPTVPGKCSWATSPPFDMEIKGYGFGPGLLQPAPTLQQRHQHDGSPRWAHSKIGDHQPHGNWILTEGFSRTEARGNNRLPSPAQHGQKCLNPLGNRVATPNGSCFMCWILPTWTSTSNGKLSSKRNTTCLMRRPRNSPWIRRLTSPLNSTNGTKIAEWSRPGTHLPSMCGWAVETQNGLVPCKSENAKTEWPK